MIRWILVLVLICSLGSFRPLHWDEPPEGGRAVPPDPVQVIITDLPRRTGEFPGQESPHDSGEATRPGPGVAGSGVQKQLQGR